MLPDDYAELLTAVKERIRGAQTRAALAVNRELVLLHWRIGGTSRRAFAAAYPDEAFAQQVVAQIPWGHNVRILDMVKDSSAREWYARKAIEHGWSRNILVHQIEGNLHGLQGKPLTNFERTLPAPQSDLAQQVLKDPYNFDFLTLGQDAQERDLERGFLEHLRAFLLELGVGFAFVGSQCHLGVGEQDFYIDLLFYHLRLRCFVVPRNESDFRDTGVQVVNPWL